MKKFKKVLSTIMAASIVSGSVSAINALATSPRIYVDIVYEDANTPRADIYFENMPTLRAGGFHIALGDGWEAVTSIINGEEVVEFSRENATIPSFCLARWSEDYNAVFITFSGNTYNYDVNGKFVSIYIQKTANYTSQNATANLLVLDGDGLWHYPDNGTEVDCLEEFAESNPIMLRADEYMIGDATGNHVIDARDASEILSGINSTGLLSVHEIRNSYKNIFVNAESPAAPDADQNGYINSSDANAVLSYYAGSATGGTYEGSIGSISVYETYND